MNKALIVLPLTFLTSLIFFAVLAGIIATGTTLDIDKSVLLWINEHASPAFDSFFVAVTQLGGMIVVTLTTLILFMYLLFKKQYPRALLIGLGVGGAAAIGYILKSVFDRPRPDLWEWLIVETNFSFPSGHAVASSALALCIIALAWHTKWRTLAIILGIIYTFAIGISRLYLGVHFPTDIIGGWLLSTAWVTLITSIIYMYVLDNRKMKRILFWK